jgi:hypothetical protein
VTIASTLLLLTITAPVQVPTVLLGPADARSADGFTSIFAVHELADGRVLLTDNLDNAIRLIDLDGGRVLELGRRGSGPREYMSAQTIVRGRGDTVLVTDNAQRRFVRVIRGEIVGVEPHPDALRSQSQISAPLADAQGRLYFDVRDIEMRESGFTERDAHVLRWTSGAAGLDTVARLPVTNHARRTNAGYNPFVYRSAWGLAPDGSIAVVTVDPYGVTWIRDGRASPGPTLTYDRIAVDAAERDAERIAFASRGRSALSFRESGGARSSRPSPDPELRQRIPDEVFPPFKPPIVVSRVLVSPAGEVWIPRAGPWDAEWSIIDVVDRDGRPLRHIRLPARQRLVGFGRNTLYIAVTDDDDLQWLERIPLR